MAARRRLLMVVMGLGPIALLGAIAWQVRTGPPPQLGASEAFREALGQPCPEPADTPLLAQLVPLTVTTEFELAGATALTFSGERGFVATREGVVHSFAPGGPLDVFVDLSGETSVDSDRGLLDIVVAMDGNELLVLRTDERGDTVLTAHPLSSPLESAALVRIEQPDPRHNGGGLAVDQNGVVYVGVGDGGGQGDPAGEGSDRSSLLGSILRFDRHVEPTTPEVWASGVRNPFRLWFDTAGDLWVGDVGERCVEEVTRIDVEAAAPDLGWSAYEGSTIFDAGRAAGRRSIAPVAEWSHADGSCAVVGGATYEGTIDGLTGTQIVAELCTGRLFSVDEGGSIRQIPVRLDSPTDVNIGPDGELWITDMAVGVRRIEGHAADD